jgi:hypothetical protein
VNEQLDKERAKARNEIFTAVQGILGDKSRKRDEGFTQSFVDLLFTSDCLEENNESATLQTITSMLIARQMDQNQSHEGRHPVGRTRRRHLALDRSLLARPPLLLNLMSYTNHYSHSDERQPKCGVQSRAGNPPAEIEGNTHKELLRAEWEATRAFINETGEKFLRPTTDRRLRCHQRSKNSKSGVEITPS